MFGRGFTIGHLFGFRIRLDLSWFFIVALITWNLAVDAFPAFYDQFAAPLGAETEPDTATYWLMGILGAIGLLPRGRSAGRNRRTNAATGIDQPDQERAGGVRRGESRACSTASRGHRIGLPHHGRR